MFIGDRVGIAQGVILGTSSGVPQSKVYGIFGSNKGPTVIEDDAWIGGGAIILPNITIFCSNQRQKY